MFLLVGGDSEIGRIAAAQLGTRAVATTRRPRGARDARILLDLAEDHLARFEPPAGVTSACILAAVARLGDCERDPVGSARVNVAGTLTLAERLIARGVHVLFVSSDKVFDGTIPRVPADAPTAPASEYGRQKARTEAALRTYMQRGAPVAILRIAKVLSPATALLRDWRAALTAKKPIRAFHDMTMAPVAAATVVHAIETLMRERARGIYQLSGPRDVAYLDAAFFLAERLGAERSLVVRATLADTHPPKGAGPPHTTLDSSALAQRYGIAAPDAFVVLAGVLDANLGALS
ncbi:MAG TPA: sugar nucleotide-binding protein [Xanthobacteraceae bacterium]|nr:sugar nucleotide-binding protein [Xanthobacteraceae bacterium]